jgi:aryl-alcohol dehydrogenase-like predicted oxidoreductase
MHRPDPETPIGETLNAMADEINAGRIEIIGCSNYSADQLQEALDASAAGGYPRFAVIQPPYNLVNNRVAADLFPLCRREGIAVTPHSPLGNGFLTGKYTPDRTKLPAGTRLAIAPNHIDMYFHERGWRVLSRLREKSADLGMPMVKLAMAWTMSHPDVTAVLVGARESRHIDNALEAYEMAMDQDLRAEMSAW